MCNLIGNNSPAACILTNIGYVRQVNVHRKCQIDRPLLSLYSHPLFIICTSFIRLHKPPFPTFPRIVLRLERKSLAGTGHDGALGVARSKERVAVRDAVKRSGGGGVLAAAEADILNDGVSGGIAVGEVDGLVAATFEHDALDEELGTLARVDDRVDVRVVRVEDVAGAEAERGSTAVDILEV